MNEAAVRAFMIETRNCALAMLESASYIQDQLDNVQMKAGLRTQTEQVCTALLGTKHDIFNELFELEALLASGATAAAIRSRVKRIIQWIRDDIAQMDQLVAAIKSAGHQDPATELAYVLVAEPATNILLSFNRTRAASDALHAEDGRTL